MDKESVQKICEAKQKRVEQVFGWVKNGKSRRFIIV